MFEKIYFPYLLVAKKRYAGLFWTKGDKPDKQDVKGMESVRRDNCLLVKNTISQMISTILVDRNMQMMVQRLVDRVESVAKGLVDLSELVISKSLSKPPQEYYPIPPQAQVAIKMAKENPDTAPKMGDRVPYIITAYGGRKEKTSKKAEHPIKIIKYNLPVDKRYYIDNQLRKPCERILEPLIPGITNKIFSSISSTIYIPATADQFARKAETVAPPVPKAPPKKAAAKGKNAPKGLFNGQVSATKKALPILAGQKSLSFSPSGGGFLKAPERKITDKKEGLTEIHIKHTVTMASLSSQKGSIGNFAVVKPRCLCCSRPIDTDDDSEETAPAFCESCIKASKEDPTFKPQPAEDLRAMHKEHYDWSKYIWDGCVTCQGVATVEDLRECGTWECPEFFKRVSAKEKLRRIQEKLKRFEYYLDQTTRRMEVDPILCSM